MPWEPNKKVFLLPDRATEAMAGNPNLYGYKHLTNAFFYPYVNGSYQTDEVDASIFKDKYIDDTNICFARDPNHPELILDHVLNLETQNVWNTDLEGYWDRTQQYINMANMIKTVGQAAYIYGVSIGPVEYNRWWNIGRYTYRLNPDLYPDYEANLANSLFNMKTFRREERIQILGKLNRLRDRFAPFVDAMVLDCYQFYKFDDVNDDYMYFWRYMVQRKIECYRYVFGPDMPLSVFLQPVFTEDFSPLPPGVWDIMLGEMNDNPDVDRIYIFNINETQPGPDWQDPLINGPVYTPIGVG